MGKLQRRVLACLVSCNVFLLTEPLYHSSLFCNFRMQTFFHRIFINRKMLLIQIKDRLVYKSKTAFRLHLRTDVLLRRNIPNRSTNTFRFLTICSDSLNFAKYGQNLGRRRDYPVPNSDSGILQLERGGAVGQRSNDGRGF